MQKLNNPGSIIEDMENLMTYYGSRQITLSALALGPDEYLRFAAYIASMKMSHANEPYANLTPLQYKELFIFAKTDQGIVAILKNNNDVLKLAMPKAK